MYFFALKVTWKTQFQILKYFLSNYSVYRKDRNRQGGGVFIAVRTDIPSCEVNIVSSLEIIWFQLHTISSGDVILGCFYHPPHLPSSVLDNLRDSLQHIRSQFPSAKITLGGDFNCSGIEWSTGTLFESYISPTLRDTLITTMDDFLMQQVVTFPTRGTNILDLCFTTDPDLVQSCQPFPGVSDHDIVLLKFLNFKLFLLRTTEEKYTFTAGQIGMPYVKTFLPSRISIFSKIKTLQKLLKKTGLSFTLTLQN